MNLIGLPNVSDIMESIVIFLKLACEATTSIPVLVKLICEIFESLKDIEDTKAFAIIDWSYICQEFWMMSVEKINWKIDKLFSSKIKESKLAFEKVMKSEETNHNIEQLPPNSAMISDLFNPLFPNISVLSKTESRAVLNSSATGLLLA